MSHAKTMRRRDGLQIPPFALSLLRVLALESFATFSAKAGLMLFMMLASNL